MQSGIKNTIKNMTRNGIKISKAALAVTAIAAGGALISSHPASAIVTQDNDVLLRSIGFDFGGSTGFSSGTPTSPGSVVWDQLADGVLPTVRGYIHFDGVNNTCARIRVTSFDAAGVQIGQPAFSKDNECVNANGHQAREMSPVVGELGAGSVEITLQSSAKGSSSWGRVAQTTVTYGPTLGTNDFRIIDDEFDVGSGEFDETSETAPDLANLTWKVESGTTSTLTPVFNGTLYMYEADDLCGRIKVEYISQLGTSTTRFTNDHCVEDDEAHQYHMVLNDYHATDVYEVIYTVQKRPNGAVEWTDVASSAPLFVH